ncbi:MAG: hypothetical protein ACOH2R_24820 [Pseudomonas sp.]
MQILAIILLVLVGAVGTVLMKVGAEKMVYGSGVAAGVRSALTNVHLLVGIGLQLVPLAGWTVLLKTMPLTKLQPMIALTYVVTPVLAIWLLGESMPMERVAGVALITVGVVLVGIS